MTNLVKDNLKQAQQRPEPSSQARKFFYSCPWRRTTGQVAGTLQHQLEWGGGPPPTYELEMPKKRKQQQVFHINLMKEWDEREGPLSQQLLVQAVKEEEDTPEQFLPTDHPAGEIDHTHLTPQQQQELRAVIPDGLFSDQPGATSMTENHMTTSC